MILNKVHYEEIKNLLENETRNEYSDSGLSSVNNELLYEVMRNYEQKKGESLKSYLEAGTRYRKLFDSFVEKNGQKGNILLSYAMGEFAGIIKVLEKLVIFIFGKEKKREDLTGLCASRKYIKQILLQIYNNSDIRHGELAKELGIAPNYLNELIKLLEPTGSINKYAYGKSTYYELTLEGQRYVKENLREPDQDLPQLYLPKEGEIPVENSQLLLIGKNHGEIDHKKSERIGGSMNDKRGSMDDDKIVDLAYYYCEKMRLRR